MAYRVVTVKDGKVVGVHGNVTAPTPRKSSSLNVGVFGQSAGGWPMKSDAMGVNPDQIADAVAADAKNGINQEYDLDTGQAVYNDPKGYQRHAESQGMADRNGGYGSPQVGGIKKYERDPEDS